jgi:hypothetical protein
MMAGRPSLRAESDPVPAKRASTLTPRALAMAIALSALGDFVVPFRIRPIVCLERPAAAARSFRDRERRLER